MTDFEYYYSDLAIRNPSRFLSNAVCKKLAATSVKRNPLGLEKIATDAACTVSSSFSLKKRPTDVHMAEAPLHGNTADHQHCGLASSFSGDLVHNNGEVNVFIEKNRTFSLHHYE